MLAVGNPDICVVKITKRQFIITENVQIWLTGVDQWPRKSSGLKMIMSPFSEPH